MTRSEKVAQVEKDEMILRLHDNLLREQQVAAEVQFLQEKEIIDKGGQQVLSINF